MDSDNYICKYYSFIGGKYLFEGKNCKDNTGNTVDIADKCPEQIDPYNNLIGKLVGVWKTCPEDYCYYLAVRKNNDNIYELNFFGAGLDGITKHYILGALTNDNKNYLATVLSTGYSYPLLEQWYSYENINFNMSQIDNQKFVSNLFVENMTYEYITYNVENWLEERGIK